ncbi:MAG: hypothetical protein JNJ75_09005 [Cyclobacteriaceae bacterium]|nr:hypothetical protein [Cyclobacteriaceae bacterium]
MKLAVFKGQTAKLAAIGLAAIVIVVIAGKETFRAMVRYFELDRELKAMSPVIPASSQEVTPYAFLLKETELEREIFAALSRTSQAYGVNLRQVHPAIVFNTGEVLTISQKVTLEGGFVSILKGVRDIQDIKGVKISSIRFETEHINRMNLLVAHIYFQGVKHIEE